MRTMNKKFLTDMHTHSTFSPDGKDTLEKMLEEALKLGVGFYGVSEHVDYDVYLTDVRVFGKQWFTDQEAYFHRARRLQEDYAGSMNVIVGAEFAYAYGMDEAEECYLKDYEKYKPDFVINSVHTLGGHDYCRDEPFYKTNEKGERLLRTKDEVYKEYFAVVKKSLAVPYPYDIVGHVGYVSRYAPYKDRSLTVKEFPEEWDGILKEIIARDKILEVNTSNKLGVSMTLPDVDALKRYFELGGRKVSFGSDAHFASRILDKREETVKILKEIGFTYITVPCRGEHIKVEI